LKELVVLSGKGGTGKTTVTAAFARLARSVVVADCDVDAADLPLVLAPRIEERHPFVGGTQARIRADDCATCGNCYEICQFNAVRRLAAADGAVSYRIDPHACEGCGVCAHFCPEQAIDCLPAPTGEWYVSRAHGRTLVHARLAVAAENSGKLVTQVRDRARAAARKERRELMIVDGPPGVGCPVIASVGGADLVLVVAEPTVAGIHDLERVVRLARHFQVEAVVAVNKYDLSPEQTEGLEAWCARERVPVLGRIPFDPGVVRALVAGRTIVDPPAPAAGAAVRALWREVQRRLSTRVGAGGV
jgi:MinD superfamily P-loop ATPase